MSDQEPEESPRGAAAEAPPGEVSEEEMEGAKKNRFRTKGEWKQIHRFPVEGKSEDEIQSVIIEYATDQLRPWLPAIFVDHKTLDTDLYHWKRKEQYVKSQVVNVVSYRCPLNYACNCPSMLRVLRCGQAVAIEIKHEHDVNSHKANHLKKLKVQDRSAVWSLVRGNPTVSATAARRMTAAAGSADIPVSHHRSVQYLVRKAKDATIEQDFCGVKLDGTIQSYSELKQALWFTKMLDRFFFLIRLALLCVLHETNHVLVFKAQYRRAAYSASRYGGCRL